MLATKRRDMKNSPARERTRIREKTQDKGVRVAQSVQPIKRSSESSSGLCQRCQGYMVREYYMDRFDGNCLWGIGWRCVNCGAVIDPVIDVHQQRGKPGIP